MSGVSVWVLTIVGIILVGIIVDIILPEGSINKFVRGLIAIFTVFAIVSPLPSISLDKIDFGSFFDNDKAQVDDNFIEQINNQKITEYEMIIESTLKQQGYHGVDIHLYANYIDYDLEITEVFADLSQLVLNDKNLNINKYDQITNIIKKIVDVKEENILFYGGTD